MGGKIILGIDPGSRVTGYAVIRQAGRSFVVQTSGTLELVAALELSRRLALLQEGVERLLVSHCPEVLAVEDVFSARNARSALLLGHARGVVLACAGRQGLPVVAYPPATVKKAVAGHGRATKEQVQRMVQVLLSLSFLPSSDEADAIAVALCHGLCGRAPLCPGRPTRRIRFP